MHPHRLTILRRLAPLGLLLAALALPARAATLNVPSQYPTIQSGINAANTGDTVLVAPGTYTLTIYAQGTTPTITHTTNVTFIVTP